MTSLLYWKSLQVSKQFHNRILNYSLIVYPDPEAEQFVVSQNPVHRCIFLCYLSCLISMLICYAVVVYETLVINTMEMPIEVRIAMCFLLGIILICLLLIQFYLGNNQIMFTQHLNSMLKFEKRVFKTPKIPISERSMRQLFIQGTHFCQKFKRLDLI